MLEIYANFVGQRVRAVPGGDPLKQKAVPSREGFPEETRVAYQVGNFSDTALQSEEASATLKRCRSQIEFFEFSANCTTPKTRWPHDTF